MSETAAAHPSTLPVGARNPATSPRLRWLAAASCLLLLLGGCGTFSGRSADGAGEPGRRGGYYLDDGPGDNPPANLDRIPDAVPRVEPLVPGTLRPYSVMGRSYVPMTQLAPYRKRGMATWYGRRYHGQRTASGEIYDMYAMTGAHPVLPIPSYVRVTHLGNGRSVIVRVNDRGPFLAGRLIDLSYAAAHKLDLVRSGSALVEVEAIVPGWQPSSPATLEAQAEPPAAEAPPPALQAQAAAKPIPPPDGATTEPLPAAETIASAVPTPAPPAASALPVPPAPEQVAAVAENAAAVEADGFYVQLAAFSVADNAQRFLARVRVALASVAPALAIVSSGNVHRVHAGPYADRDQALQAAARIGQSLGSEPVLVPPR